MYARVSGSIDWINEQICDLSDIKPLSCQREDPAMPPTAPPEGSLPVRISLTLDDYPEEVGLELLQGSEVLYSKNEGAFSGMKSFSDTIHLPPGDYKVKLVDSFSDGMCCQYGNGAYEISVSFLDGNAMKIAAGDGSFDDTLFIDLRVPEDPNAPKKESTLHPTISPTATPPPSIGNGPNGNAAGNGGDPQNPDNAADPPNPLNPACQDNPSAAFLVDSVVGTAGCAFLSLNMERYSYLCQFLKVAHGCPSTCDACAYFK